MISETEAGLRLGGREMTATVGQEMILKSKRIPSLTVEAAVIWTQKRGPKSAALRRIGLGRN